MGEQLHRYAGEKKGSHKRDGMIQTIWTYRVREERQDEFENRYCADGDWARLFPARRATAGRRCSGTEAAPRHTQR